jgi:hypothetical protein
MKGYVQRSKICLLLLIVIGFGTGCTGNDNRSVNQDNQFNVTKVHTSQPINQSISNQAKELSLTNEEVTDVKAVNSDKDLLVAIKVENFDRLRLKEIEKKVKTDLKKLPNGHKIEVSTDQKMFIELRKLEEKLQNEEMKKKSLQKELDRINKLMKEQA